MESNEKVVMMMDRACSGKIVEETICNTRYHPSPGLIKVYYMTIRCCMGQCSPIMIQCFCTQCTSNRNNNKNI